MLPREFEQRMQQLLGASYASFLQSYDHPRNVGLRFNALKTPDIPQLPFHLTPVAWAAHGYYYDPTTRPGLHPYHEAGVYYLQEPSAMAPVTLLDPQPGEWILDLCAAPGGKTTQIASAMNGQGLLVCNEIHPARSKILSHNIERMGITNALVLNETPQRLAQRLPHCFDRILVDAPCSGEGMFRKEEAALEDWSEAIVARCAQRQQEILDAAAQMLKPGGRLVYSTCTFAPAENEGTLSNFMKSHPDFSIEAPVQHWFAPGHPEWVEQPVPGLEKACRLWPHLLAGEGHFAALLQNNGNEERTCEPCRADASPPEWNSFAAENLPNLPSGKLLQFGANLYAVPEQTPSLHALRVLRAGLALGELKKGRFEPAHALALATAQAVSTVHYAAQSDAIDRYLHGDVLTDTATGWTLVCVDKFSLGWAKGSGGMLKNHFPKGLRWTSHTRSSAFDKKPHNFDA